MRIRLALTFSIQRRQEPPAEYREVDIGSHIERADEPWGDESTDVRRIGFQAPGGNPQ